MCVKQEGQCITSLAAVCPACGITVSEDTSGSCRSHRRSVHKTFDATLSCMTEKKWRKYLKRTSSKLTKTLENGAMRGSLSVIKI